MTDLQGNDLFVDQTRVIGSLESKSPFSPAQRVPSLFVLFPTSPAPLALLEVVLPLANRQKHENYVSLVVLFISSRSVKVISGVPCSLSFLSSSSFFSCAFWALVSFLWRGKDKRLGGKHIDCLVGEEVQQWPQAQWSSQNTPSAFPWWLWLCANKTFLPTFFFLGDYRSQEEETGRMLEVKVGMQHRRNLRCA